MSASTSAVTSSPITFSGLASGVDTDSIVTKLMAVDQLPITALQNAETAATNKLKAYSAINTLMATLQTAAGAMNLTSEVRTTTANVSANSPFTATSNNAFSGSYTISVSQLAQVQKDISSGFSSNTGSVLGTGTVTINGQAITVNAGNNSLQGLMSAINQTTGTTGVTASIINDGSTGTGATPYHLVLTGKDASSNFTVSSSLQDTSSGNTISLGGVDTSTRFSSDSASLLGTGTVTIGNLPPIIVTPDNNSLQGLMSAINETTGTTGLTASIINDGSTGTGATPYHLIITGQDGTSPAVSSSLLDSQGNAIPLEINTSGPTTVQTAQQAKLTIDGIDVVSNSNTVSGAIAGVTLNLNAISTVSSAGPPAQYATSKLDITPDTTTLEKNINTFVTSYNAIMSWINAGYTEASKNLTSTTATDPNTAADPTDAQLSQILLGDSTVNGIKRQLQSILSGSVNSSTSPGALNNLSQIGISTSQDGTLNVNTSALESALQNNFSGVTGLLAGDGSSTGVMEQFNSYLLKLNSVTQGMYATKKTNYQSKIKDLDNQINTKTEALNKSEASMKARFTAMELLVSNLNSQSSYLNTLYNLAGISNTSSSNGSSSTG